MPVCVTPADKRAFDKARIELVRFYGHSPLPNLTGLLAELSGLPKRKVRALRKGVI